MSGSNPVPANLELLKIYVPVDALHLYKKCYLLESNGAHSPPQLSWQDRR
jgi:hypothetical protein